jgi:Leucine-rich repeat (LRR) protein
MWIISTLIFDKSSKNKLKSVLALAWCGLTILIICQYEFAKRPTFPLPLGEDGVDFANLALDANDIMTINGSQIRSIGLRNTNITDDLFLKLKPSVLLEVIDLRKTSVTDNSVRHLIGFPNLRIIRLGQTNITDNCFTTISKLNNLDTLDLSETKISGHELTRLTCLKQLRYLNLASNKLRSENMGALLQFKGLKHLDISNCQISEKDLERLLATMPKQTQIETGGLDLNIMLGLFIILIPVLLCLQKPLKKLFKS